jgi:hypothetical protein
MVKRSLAAFGLLLGLVALFLFCQRKWDNPYINSGYDTPPKAHFTVSCTKGTTDTVYYMDASGCKDAEDNVSKLKVRWDWESDGKWDTDWSTVKAASHKYSTGGVKAITMEVMDMGGLTDTATVALGVNSPPIASFTLGTRYHYPEGFYVYVNASGGNDNEDPIDSLKVRWDWENDGVWDTDWKSAKQDTHIYDLLPKNCTT